MKKMKKKTKRRIKKVMIGFMLAAISLPLFSGFMPREDTGVITDPELAQAMLEAQQEQSEEGGLPMPPALEANRRLGQIVDGSTITVFSGEDETPVRFIGVNVTKEMQKNAIKFLQDKFSTHDMVILEFDAKDKDAGGNLLAYVYLPDDIDTSLNSVLLANGYAKLKEEPENKKHEEALRNAEQQARERGVGLWANDKEKTDDR